MFLVLFFATAYYPVVYSGKDAINLPSSSVSLYTMSIPDVSVMISSARKISSVLPGKVQAFSFGVSSWLSDTENFNSASPVFLTF